MRRFERQKIISSTLTPHFDIRIEGVFRCLHPDNASIMKLSQCISNLYDRSRASQLFSIYICLFAGIICLCGSFTLIFLFYTFDQFSVFFVSVFEVINLISPVSKYLGNLFAEASLSAIYIYRLIPRYVINSLWKTAERHIDRALYSANNHLIRFTKIHECNTVKIYLFEFFCRNTLVNDLFHNIFLLYLPTGLIGIYGIIYATITSVKNRRICRRGNT